MCAGARGYPCGCIAEVLTVHTRTHSTSPRHLCRWAKITCVSARPESAPIAPRGGCGGSDEVDKFVEMSGPGLDCCGMKPLAHTRACCAGRVDWAEMPVCSVLLQGVRGQENLCQCHQDLSDSSSGSASSASEGTWRVTLQPFMACFSPQQVQTLFHAASTFFTPGWKRHAQSELLVSV